MSGSRKAISISLGWSASNLFQRCERRLVEPVFCIPALATTSTNYSCFRPLPGTIEGVSMEYDVQSELVADC